MTTLSNYLQVKDEEQFMTRTCNERRKITESKGGSPDNASTNPIGGAACGREVLQMKPAGLFSYLSMIFGRHVAMIPLFT